MTWTENVAQPGSELEWIRKLATTDAVVNNPDVSRLTDERRAEVERTLLILGRAREAALASLSDGELHDLAGDYASYDHAVMEAAQMAARGRALARAVLAADALLPDLDVQGGPSRTVALALWDQIVQLARVLA